MTFGLCEIVRNDSCGGVNRWCEILIALAALSTEAEPLKRFGLGSTVAGGVHRAVAISRTVVVRLDRSAKLLDVGIGSIQSTRMTS